MIKKAVTQIYYDQNMDPVITFTPMVYPDIYTTTKGLKPTAYPRFHGKDSDQKNVDPHLSNYQTRKAIADTEAALVIKPVINLDVYERIVLTEL